MLVSNVKYGINITDVVNILDSDTFKKVSKGDKVTGTLQTPEAIVPVVDLNFYLNGEYLLVDKFKSVIIVKQYTADTEFEIGLLVGSVNGTYDIVYNQDEEIEKVIDDYENELPADELILIDPHTILNRDDKLIALTKYYRRMAPITSNSHITIS